MKHLDTLAPGISRIHSETLELTGPFADFAARWAHKKGTVVLLSGGDHDCARYHFLAADPWLSFSGIGNAMTLASENQTFAFEADPFDTLQHLVQRYALDDPQLPVPVSAGLFGYLSYDLKDHLEDLPKTSVDDTGLPHICFFAPSILVIHDKITHKTRLLIPEHIGSDAGYVHKIIDAFKKTMAALPPVVCRYSGERRFKSNFARPDYLSAIERIIQYIRTGHVYQVNMSQRFEMGFEGDGYALFKDLYRMNPAPFFAWVNAGDHQVISTSPERFVSRTRNTIETRPIKGTRPRGASPDQDQKLKNDLATSKKDDAELSMIVDLLRNDMGKVCKGGTVRVTEHKRLEAYSNVYHLVSIIKGELEKGCDSIDIVKATFPGGSITGCPKIRAMEIIDEMEPNRRHIYTGSIGYIGFHDTMDFSIAIRTATHKDDRLVFSVGGGIVYDSDPADEFEETLHKGKTFMDLCKDMRRRQPKKEPWAWHNGILRPLDQVRIPVTDLGLQYGFGFFETIRVENGKIQLLELHIQRFNHAWSTLFKTRCPDLTWSKVIDQVIEKNQLKDQTAAVKILATKGEIQTPCFSSQLVVSARPYTHRIKGRHPFGLDAGIYPKPRHTPLADHKTLNYLYYYLAGQWATENAYDEAVICNPDQTISETHTANILVIKDKTIIRPLSDFVLPGIMEQKAIEFFSDHGFDVLSRPLQKQALFEASMVVVTNSLMGVVPLLSLDGKPVERDPKLAGMISDYCF